MGDGKALLMGKALLKTHTLNGKRYHYFGYFSQDNFMPIEKDFILSKFRENFRISRNNNETGLSVVIPLPVDEISFDSIMRGVIKHYYYPILEGTLKVEVQDNVNNRLEELNSKNLIGKASGINWIDNEWKKIDIVKILKFIKDPLVPRSIRLHVQEPENPDITQESFGGQIETFKENFLEGLPLRFEVPVTIRKAYGGEEESFVSILLKRFPEFGKPFEAYIRSGVLISEVKMLGNRPVAGLLIAEDPAVCEFLGDCETPAHTSWNERTEGFAEKYINAARILRFIRRSILQIVSILDEPPRERQVDFLKDIFSVPIGPEEGEEEESTRPPNIPPIEREIPKFNIERIQRGFRVVLNPKRTGLSFPFQATVKMAYDTRRGNPFSQYDKFDFDVASASITTETRNCNIIERKGNILKVEITGENFELKVTGFDPKRDLVTDVK
jgi:hypothetical protein